MVQQGEPFELIVQIGMLRLDGLAEIDESPDVSSLVSLLGAEPGAVTLDDIQARTQALAVHDRDLNAVPRDDLILHRIVWPLRAAKQSYILGNFLGCIALCGTISEMLAILRFAVSEYAGLSSGSQQRLYGNRFDRLGQSRRIDVLSELKLYDTDEAALARQIKEKRDHYLHALDVSSLCIEADAMIVYGATVKIVDFMVGVRGSSPAGTVAPRSHLLEYLQERGVLKAKPPPSNADNVGEAGASGAVPDISDDDDSSTHERRRQMQFRDDWAEHGWDVKGIREQVGYLDHPFIRVSYTGKYGLPVKGPSEFAFRKALELIDAGQTGQHIVNDNLVITIEGLDEGSTVRMLEGSGAGDPKVNLKLNQP